MENKAQDTRPKLGGIFQQQMEDLMSERNLSQRDVVKMTGFSPSVVSDWLNSKKTPKADALIRLSSSLHVSVDYLLGLQKSPTTDIETKAVCQFTGLSEKAIKNLLLVKEQSRYFSPSKVFEANSFLELMNTFQALVFNLYNLRAKIEEIDKEEEWEQRPLIDQMKEIGIIEDEIHKLKYDRYEFSDICHAILNFITDNDFDDTIEKGATVTQAKGVQFPSFPLVINRVKKE